MAAPVRDAEWISWVTKLLEGPATSRERERTASDGFRCRLEEQPSHLVPERLLRQLRGPGGGELFVNPWCALSSDAEAPSGVRDAAELLEVPADEAIAWVVDPGPESWMPFWLGWEVAALVDELRRDRRKVGDLPVAMRENLEQARILVGHDFMDGRKAKWADTIARCREKFRAQGYAPVSGLLHPFQLAALRSYFRRRIRRGSYPLGDEQSPRRYIAHNDPAARFFHVQLTKAVSDLVGEPVKPSYVYMASYQSGARLERHTDREQCEFSITMCLDYAPEPKGATRWPLYMDTKEGQVTVYQALGDGLLYRGRELPHYRNTLAEGNTSTSIFFHYVAKDFDGPLE